MSILPLPLEKFLRTLMRAASYFCNYELLCRSTEFIFLPYRNLER